MNSVQHNPSWKTN